MQPAIHTYTCKNIDIRPLAFPCNIPCRANLCCGLATTPFLAIAGDIHYGELFKTPLKMSRGKIKGHTRPVQWQTINTGKG